MLDNYQNPVTTQEDINKLHKLLVQTVIDYIREHNLSDVWEVGFSVDGLDSGFEYGEWTPGIDSSLSVIGLQEDGTSWTNKNGVNLPFKVRRLIGESM